MNKPLPTAGYPEKIGLLCLGLLLLVLFTFYPVLNNGFIFIDDPYYVTANPHVQSGLTWANIKWAMTASFAANWHPLTWISHMLDCQWYGLNPRGHHLTNLLFHAANTVMLFLMLAEMTGALGKSFFVAALFGLHPMHIESVAWVAERKDVLSTFFFLLTLLCYGRYARARAQAQPEQKSSNIQHSTFNSQWYYGLALVLFVLGLMSKPMLVTLPFVLLLLDYWPLNRFRAGALKKLLIEKIPFVVASAAVCVITVMAQKSGGGIRSMATFSMSERIENTPVSYARYLAKFFWPAKLSFYYPHPGHWPLRIVCGATVLFLVLSAGAWFARRRHPYVSVGWCWFVGTLVPVIGLVQVGFQSMANRYSYVPYIGLFIALAWGVPAWIPAWRFRNAILAAVAAVAVAACVPIMRQQISYWRDSELLFRYAATIVDNNWEAYSRLGLLLSKEGRLDEAIDEYRIGLKMKPDDADARYDLANALCRTGRWDEAIEQFQLELKISPGDYSGHNNLGAALFHKGRVSEAVAQFQEALRLKPDYSEARKNLDTALAVQRAPVPSPRPAVPEK